MMDIRPGHQLIRGISMSAFKVSRIIWALLISLLLLTCSKLTQTNLNSPPEIPSDPVPVDGAVLDSLDFEFMWTCSDLDGDPLTYEIYIDTIATPAIYDSLIDTTVYASARLFYNRTYFWQIVAEDSTGQETESPVWSFVLGDDETVPTVTITSPNGGELWYVDNEYDITWEAADDDSIASYKLEYTANEGTTWVDIQDWTDGNPQTFAWTVPATPSTYHLVRVSCQDFGGNIVSDTSDTLFTAWPEGGLIAFESNRDGAYNIFTMFSDGSNPQNITNSDADNLEPSWSPDCSQIAFMSNRDGNQEIYIMNSNGTNQVNISNNSSDDFMPAWSPNGDKIAFSSDRTGNNEVYIMNVDGTEQYNLTVNGADDFYCSWNPDGDRIAFHSYRGSNWDVYLMDSDGSNLERITTHAAVDAYPDWSPNGLLIVFRSSIPGNYDIYLMNYDGSNQHNISSHSADDHWPQWSPDGANIIFYSNRTVDWEIYVMNTDGTNLINLSNDATAHDMRGTWSPIY